MSGYEFLNVICKPGNPFSPKYHSFLFTNFLAIYNPSSLPTSLYL